MSNAVCSRCRSALAPGAAFCSVCGQQQGTQPAQPQQPPVYQQPPPTIIVQQKSGASTFWIVFTLLTIFTPLGCIVIPILVLGGGAAVLAGIAIIPLILMVSPMIAAIIVAANLVRKDRAAGRQPNMAMTAGILAIGAAVSLGMFAVVQGTGGGSSSTSFDRGSSPSPTPTPLPENRPYVAFVSIDDFGNFYDKNKFAAKTQYGGKRVAIRGQVEQIGGSQDQGIVLLKGVNTNTQITCLFNERTSMRLAEIADGQMIDVIGQFDGGESQSLGSDRLTFTDCTLPQTQKAQPQRKS